MYNMQLNTGYAGKPHVTAENCADLNRGIVGSLRTSGRCTI